MTFEYSSKPLIPINVTAQNYISPPFLNRDGVHGLDHDLHACGPHTDLPSRSGRAYRGIGGAPVPLVASAREKVISTVKKVRTSVSTIST
jgi:hypothetical protein